MADAKRAPHYYGGQALLEGVMMRGRRTWAVAVRRPSEEIYVESHPVRGLAVRHPIFQKPLLRGIAAMTEALSIGMRALRISANEALEEEEKLTSRQMALTMAFAVALFIGIFIILPNVVTNATARGSKSVATHVWESAIRLGIFLGYLVAMSFLKEMRRVFMYHGAEHKTIAAYEAGEPELNPTAVDRYSTLHVRCGTNFLIITMILTIIVYSLLGRPAVWLQIVERVLGIFVLAGIAYEGLRLGAGHFGNPIVRALMKPGLWLQMITTKPPTPDQIEVAIRSFEAVLPHEERSKVAPLPSSVVLGDQQADPEGAPSAEP